MSTVEEVDTALSKRYGAGVNEFWLSHGPENFPALCLLVNGDLATLTYLPQEGHPGYRSEGKVRGLERDRTSTFYVNNETEELEIMNESIVPFCTAVEAAKDFLISRQLPKSIEWLEL